MSVTVGRLICCSRARKVITAAIVVALLPIGVVCWLTGGVAQASVVRIRGNVLGAPSWVGSHALLAVGPRKNPRIDTVEPQTGESREQLPLTGEYARARALPLGTGFLFEGIRPNYGGSKYEPGYIGEHELLFGQPGSPLRCLARFFHAGCDLPEICTFGTAVVSGSSLAYPACNPELAHNETGTVVFDTISSQLQTVPQIVLPLGLSGPWLVGLAPGWNPEQTPTHEAAPMLVERNLLTGSEPVRAPLASWPHLAADQEEALRAVAAVQEDGALVYAVEAGRETALWTASPTQPVPQPIMTIHVGLGWLKELPLPLVLREGRLAFPDDEGREFGPRQVTIATLQGVRLGSLRVLGQDGFDYDGTRVLATSRPCGTTYLLAWAPGEPHPRVPGNGCTASRLIRLRVQAARITLVLRCPEGGECETGEISVSAGPIHLTAEGEQLLYGENENITLPLNTRDRRWLRRHPHVILTLRWGQHSRRRIRPAD